jgi:tetratricopeptide (TPR) repeat protein
MPGKPTAARGKHGRRYRAFISYSRADAAVAEWLHRALERFRIPVQLRRGRGAPARLFPVFRDREEFAATGDLHAGIIDALGRSDALIVICSPHAAVSRWVDEEVRCFRRLAPHRPVLALIAAGEPFASEIVGRTDEECFPPSLRQKGESLEPIAADLRPNGDGHRLAKLKLVAGLLDVPLGELTRRDEAMRRRRLLVAASAAGIIIAVLSLFLAIAVRSQRESERQRQQAESLVEFMIGDLRKQLEPNGQLSLLDSVGKRAFDYYRTQKRRRSDPDSLGRRARVLHLLGEVQEQRGNLDPALRYFNAAAASTKELLRRKPDDGQRIFDHAQSLYWTGYVAWERGDRDKARDNLTAYRDLTVRLTRIDPNNDAWQAERGYGESNLGTLDLSEGRVGEAKGEFEQALRVAARLLSRKAKDVDRQLVYGQGLAWLADADERLGNLNAASALRERERGLYEAILARTPEAVPVRLDLSTTHRALSRLAAARRDAPAALVHAKTAVAISQGLIRLDRNNSDYLSEAAADEVVLGEAQRVARNPLEARRSAATALAGYAALLKRDATVDSWHMGHARAALSAAGAALDEGNPALSKTLVRAAQADLLKLRAKESRSSDARWLEARASLLLAEAMLKDGNRVDAEVLLKNIVLLPRVDPEESRMLLLRLEAKRYLDH